MIRFTQVTVQAANVECALCDASRLLGHYPLANRLGYEAAAKDLKAAGWATFDLPALPQDSEHPSKYAKHVCPACCAKLQLERSS